MELDRQTISLERRDIRRCLYHVFMALTRLLKGWTKQTAFIIIRDDFNGLLSYLAPRESVAVLLIISLYMRTLQDLTSLPSQDLFAWMILKLLGRKYVIKLEGPVVTIYKFLHLRCFPCVLTRIWLKWRKALILALSLWVGHCFLFLVVRPEFMYQTLGGHFTWKAWAHALPSFLL